MKCQRCQESEATTCEYCIRKLIEKQEDLKQQEKKC
jgi:hypothetical protein